MHSKESQNRDLPPTKKDEKPSASMRRFLQMQEYVRKVKAEDAKKNQKKKKGSGSKAEDNLTEDSSKKKKKKILNVADSVDPYTWFVWQEAVKKTEKREETNSRTKKRNRLEKQQERRRKKLIKKRKKRKDADSNDERMGYALFSDHHILDSFLTYFSQKLERDSPGGFTGASSSAGGDIDAVDSKKFLPGSDPVAFGEVAQRPPDFVAKPKIKSRPLATHCAASVAEDSDGEDDEGTSRIPDNNERMVELMRARAMLAYKMAKKKRRAQNPQSFANRNRRRNDEPLIT
eukprot:jgi/Bigna1/132460/aug1.17_g7168